MCKKGTSRGICSFVLLWFTSFAVQNGSASVTAFVEIRYLNASSNQVVRQVCECGWYGMQSLIAIAYGQVELPAENLTACGPHVRFNSSADSWIALIERGDCTFSEKINSALKAGAAAVVIFNDADSRNDDRAMSHPGTGYTVAIMIGYLRGMEIVNLIRNNTTVTMTIEVGKEHGPWLSHYSVFFVSISFFVVTAATVGYFIFYSARRLHTIRLQNRKQKRLKAEAKKAIGQLQVRTLKQGDQEIGSDADTCAVCIEAYKPGDVVSILTCNHFFHKTCIEPWLLEHRTCPMCKCDILKALGVEPDVEEGTHQVPMPPDFRIYPETLEDARSETASSGYASVQGIEEHGGSAEERFTQAPSAVTQGEEKAEGADGQTDLQPHYDNLAFEGDSQSHPDPRT
ncbi:E3 ubiquitin-protein ligase RNF128a isoform X2 [Paramormyrops kingsleyae]|uniref:Ring finger protein 128a n=1 Tax=Paramormyrops kingsleyae TaxID=1676925 RepID=A0A3B3SX79_9TELE|nr:E3 ubiquitin-protein ligase RNF128 isoform X2 [Paramormyrops kingsleyae]